MKRRKAQVEIIIFKRIKNKILFLLLKRNEEKGGFWQPVTGGVRANESFDQAVMRELKEETGITHYLQRIDNVYGFQFESQEDGVLSEYVFGIEVSPATNIKLSSEHMAMKWCTLDQSSTLLKYENNKKAFKKLFSLLNSQ